MLDINELERRWRKYKIKSYIPYGVIVVSITIIVLLISTIYNSKIVTKNLSKPVQPEKIETLKQIEQNTTKVIKVAKQEKKKIENNATKQKGKQEEVAEKQEEVAKNKIINDKVVLSPSLDFMSEMKHSAVSYYNNDITSTQDKVIQNPEPVKIEKTVQDRVIQNPEPVKIEKPAQTEKEITKKSTISIKRQNTQEDISHVIKRFKKNHNPALSLFVAKKYYELGEYHKSYNYALITNGINDNIDASWIIFAKSLVKLNQKDEAIKILKKYIEHSHSSQAKLLLEEIATGKFK